MRPDLHFYQLCNLPFVRGTVVKEQSSLRSYFCVTLLRSCKTLRHLTTVTCNKHSSAITCKRTETLHQFRGRKILPLNSNLETIGVFHYNNHDWILDTCTIAVYDDTVSYVGRHLDYSTKILLWKQSYSYNSEYQYLILNNISIFTEFFIVILLCIHGDWRLNIMKPSDVSLFRRKSILHQHDTINEKDNLH